MNLVIDQGNSLTKTGVFDQSGLIRSHSLKNPDENSFMNLLNEFRIDQLMVSSVTQDGQRLYEMLRKHVGKGHFFDMHTKLPFTNLYQTKNGHTYYFCYDQGYLPLEHDYFALVKRKEYID